MKYFAQFFTSHYKRNKLLSKSRFFQLQLAKSKFLIQTDVVSPIVRVRHHITVGSPHACSYINNTKTLLHFHRKQHNFWIIYDNATLSTQCLVSAAHHQMGGVGTGASFLGGALLYLRTAHLLENFVKKTRKLMQ